MGTGTQEMEIAVLEQTEEETPEVEDFGQAVLDDMIPDEDEDEDLKKIEADMDKFAEEADDGEGDLLDSPDDVDTGEEKKPRETKPKEDETPADDSKLKEETPPPEKKTEDTPASEDPQPSNAEMAKWRIQDKERKQQIEDLTAKLQEASTKIEEMTKQISDPQTPKQPEASAEHVLGLLVRAQNDMLDPEKMGTYASKESVVADCKKALASEFSSSELRELFDRAERNEFGEFSDDISNLTARYMAVAESREIAEYRNKSESEAQANEKISKLQDERNKQLTKIAEEFPHLGKPDSDAYKKATEWVGNNLFVINPDNSIAFKDTVEYPRAVAEYYYDNPYQLARLVNSKLNLNVPPAVQSELEAANAKIAELKKQVALSDNLPDGSVPVSPNQKAKGTLDDMERELEAYGKTLEL